MQIIAPCAGAAGRNYPGRGIFIQETAAKERFIIRSCKVFYRRAKKRRRGKKGKAGTGAAENMKARLGGRKGRPAEEFWRQRKMMVRKYFYDKPVLF